MSRSARSVLTTTPAQASSKREFGRPGRGPTLALLQSSACHLVKQQAPREPIRIGLGKRSA